MAKAFSIEDGNLQNRSLISSRARVYRDIDLTFEKKPSGDVYKKTDAAAVKQAVKNILLTNKTERPFNPYFGANLNQHLFDLADTYDVPEIKDTIANAIANYEPRAYVRQVNVNINPDYNKISITVVFQIVSTAEIVQVDVSLTRLR